PIPLTMNHSCASAGAAISYQLASAAAKTAHGVALRCFIIFSGVRGSKGRRSRSLRSADFRCSRRTRPRKVMHGRLYTAGPMRHAGARQAHLDPGQCAEQRQIVEVSKVADAKHLALELVQPGAERHVEPIEEDLAQPVAVVDCGHHDP